MSSDPKPIEKSVFGVIQTQYEKLCVEQNARNTNLPFYMSGAYATDSTKGRIAQIMCDIKLCEDEINWDSDWSSRRKISIWASLTLAHCRGIICQIQQQNATVYKKLVKLQHKMRELDEAIKITDEEKRDKAVNIISDIIFAHAKFFIATGVALVTMNPVPAYLTAASAFSDVAVTLKDIFSIHEVEQRIAQYKDAKTRLEKQIHDAKTELDKSIEEFLN